VITDGTQAKTQAVIIILIPLPIHFSVIISHSQTRKIVQAVIIVIAIRTVLRSERSIIVQ
jgi:hypothetical protein